MFNEEISPSQFKNIQKILTDKIAVFDRTGIILEIFNMSFNVGIIGLGKMGRIRYEILKKHK